MDSLARHFEDLDRWLENYARADLGMVNEDDDPDLPEEDAPLNFPTPYLVQTWAAYKQHGILPEPGAYNDQPAAWHDDIRRINARYGVIFSRLAKEKFPKQDAPADLFDSDIEARDWRQME